jgi:uncharacterized protein (TIGR03435 family)
MTGQIVRIPHTRSKLSLIAAALVALAAPALHCQATASPATSPATTGPVKPIPFEIVSIRQTTPGHIQGAGFTDDGYSIHAVAPIILLGSMSKTLSGVPNWCYTERYDVMAKVAEADVPVWKNMNFKQKSLSIRPMLEDRFQLKWHKETRMESGYELEIAKNGSRLKEAVPDETYPHGPKEKDGTPKHEVVMSRTGFYGQAASMDQITSNLYLLAHAPVIDKTGLTGTYDFTLTAEPELPPTVAGSDPPVSNGPSLFSAVQNQLGLKLVPAKVPVEYLVVDHIERPTPN